MALIDGNNFYVACEQSIDPSLIGRPIVVLSNNDGCIIARSSEARELGILMGQPYFKARRELERLGVVVLSSNYELYGDISQRLMKILTIHCEQIEIYSIDEAFAHINRPFDYNLRPWARQLRALIHQHLGIAIAIGIGSSKGQAKIANHIAKTIATHSGIFDLSIINDKDLLLKDIDVKHVWGAGRQLALWCQKRGIKTALQLRDMPNNELHAQFGVTGTRLQHELRGETCLPLKVVASKKQQTCVSRSFGRPITSLEELQQAVSSHVIRAGEKLRQQKQQAKAITVFTNTSPFSQSFNHQSATAELNIPSNNTTVLLKTSLILTRKIFRPYQLLVKAGVIMGKLQSTDQLQLTLFANHSAEEEQRSKLLMQTIDNLNKRYGNGTISWAMSILNKSWDVRREQLSYTNTTHINKIPIVYS